MDPYTIYVYTAKRFVQIMYTTMLLLSLQSRSNDIRESTRVNNTIINLKAFSEISRVFIRGRDFVNILPNNNYYIA